AAVTSAIRVAATSQGECRRWFNSISCIARPPETIDLRTNMAERSPSVNRGSGSGPPAGEATGAAGLRQAGRRENGRAVRVVRNSPKAHGVPKSLLLEPV